ncbi:MAG: ribosome biogenesis GTP-binding protein YihA/YsxC [Polyangiaceae bacterium]|jgi:GTP-binding protein
MKQTKQDSAETRVVEAKFLAGAVDAASLPPPTSLEIAFAGRSNVGKSSLLNSLMQRHSLARTSATPGCTRQLNVFDVRFADGLTLHFVDLPGYGWARRSKSERSEWQGMIEGYLRNRVGLRAVVLLTDVRRGLEKEEIQLIEFLSDKRPVSEKRAVDIVLVATKVDKLAASARRAALDVVRTSARDVGIQVVVGFSAVTGDGREALCARLRDVAL